LTVSEAMLPIVPEVQFSDVIADLVPLKFIS